MENASVRKRAGRPLSFDRDAALHQAMLAFWRHGYETTSVSDLTAAMGITAPSLYTAFGDKKGLFLQAMQLYAGSMDDLQAMLDRAPTWRAAAQEMLIAAAHGFTGTDTPRGCLLASATASGSKDIVQVQSAVAGIRTAIRQRLEARIARDIGHTDAAPRAAMVIALIQGMSVLARDGMERQSLVDMANTAMPA